MLCAVTRVVAYHICSEQGRIMRILGQEGEASKRLWEPSGRTYNLFLTVYQVRISWRLLGRIRNAVRAGFWRLCRWKAMTYLDLKGLFPIALPSGLISTPFSGDSEPKGKEKRPWCVPGSRFSWPQEDPWIARGSPSPSLP